MTVSDYYQFNTDELQVFFEKLDLDERETVVKKGFNRIVDNNMMFYTDVANSEVDVEMPNRSLRDKFNAKVFNKYDKEVETPFMEDRMYSFTVKMAEKLGVGIREAVEFVVLLGAVEHVYSERPKMVGGGTVSRWSDLAEERRQQYNEDLSIEADVKVVDERVIDESVSKEDLKPER